MAIQALHSAATGMNAMSTELDVISNNLANVNTNGFKASRVNFEDLVYQQKRQPGLESGGESTPPAGLQVGLGTTISNTQYDFSKGAPIDTNSDTDLYINGDGFFKVKILEEYGGGVGYTRAGNFLPNADGELVLGNSDGPRLFDGITIPEDAVNVTVSPDGIVSAVLPDNTISPLGEIELHTFVNKAGLKSIGGNIYVETEISGPAVTGTPGEGVFGTVKQKQLETSNVNPVTELVSLIKTQRAFEMNSQTIQAADELLQTVGNLRRF
ncbi:MAG: flagellar basal-body rod protein FlgG [Phycisphaeraceae bacterium]